MNFDGSAEIDLSESVYVEKVDGRGKGNGKGNGNGNGNGRAERKGGERIMMDSGVS